MADLTREEVQQAAEVGVAWCNEERFAALCDMALRATASTNAEPRSCPTPGACSALSEGWQPAGSGEMPEEPTVYPLEINGLNNRWTVEYVSKRDYAALRTHALSLRQQLDEAKRENDLLRRDIERAATTTTALATECAELRGESSEWKRLTGVDDPFKPVRKPKAVGNSAFSRFIREASPEEKERVYGDVMDAATERQRASTSADKEKS
jgi:hypothetical protein